MTADRVEPSWQQEDVISSIVAEDPLAGDLSSITNIGFSLLINVSSS